MHLPLRSIGMATTGILMRQTLRPLMPGVADGNGILGHLLGIKDASRAVANNASQQTGIGAGLLKKNAANARQPRDGRNC